MKDLTLTQKAVIMAMARLIHRQRVTVTNVSIALEMKLAVTKVEAQRLCLDLGLYPWGKKGCTDLKVMNDYISK